MHDLVVIGGGPAGTAAAITAARSGARVLLLERGRYPRHKVCGEFVSPEALGLLASLLPETSLLQDAVRIGRARLFLDGRTFEATISPPAASLARFDLDATLWRAAEACGAECWQQVTADKITRADGGFRIRSSMGDLHARTVVDASGRWSRLNHAAAPQHGWLGLKAHLASAEAAHSTDLYFFDGGYCGVQPVAPGRLNVCAIARAEVATTLEQVLARHPRLAEASRGWRPLMAPVVTAPLLFRAPAAESDGVLRAGDAAGFIDPFAGDGISLALQTGTLCARILQRAWQREVSVEQAAQRYRDEYARRFGPAFRAAARLRAFLFLPGTMRRPIASLLHVPAIANWVVRKTRAAA